MRQQFQPAFPIWDAFGEVIAGSPVHQPCGGQAGLRRGTRRTTVRRRPSGQRSSGWLGSDTIVVQFLDRPDSQSTLAIYSRSQLGESDLGANKARIERWLSRLAEQIQPVE